MPYYRRPYRRPYTKPYYSRPYRYKKKKRNIFWRRGMNKVMRLAKFLNVEFKQHNIQTAYTASTTGQIAQWTNIAQGDSDSTRDGSSIKIASIFARGYVQIHASATASIVRLILVLDKQTNQAIYASTDLLLTDEVTSPLNIDNGRRFKVLWDKVITLSQDKPIVQFKYFKKLPIHIRYDNSAAAITSLTQSSLSLLRLSNEATNTPTVHIDARLRYVDN